MPRERLTRHSTALPDMPSEILSAVQRQAADLHRGIIGDIMGSQFTPQASITYADHPYCARRAQLNRVHFKPFYGWWIVGASFLTLVYIGGILYYGFTAFFEPVASEFGWSYASVSLAYSLRGVEDGLLNAPVGMLTDRWGPRRVIATGVVIIAGGMFLLSYTNSLGMFYAAYAIIYLGMSCCAQTMNMTAISNWFRNRVGIASGIALSGAGIGGLLIPVTVKLIDMFGWRGAINILAVGALVLLLPLSLVFRHKPEQYGYLPDGEKVKKTVKADNGTAPPQTIDLEIKAKQALKSRTFWYLLVASVLFTILLTTVVTHIMPYLSSVGIDRAQSSLVAAMIPISSIGGRIGFGWLGDKVSRKYITALAFAMIGIGLVCLTLISATSMGLTVPFLILFGIGYGAINTMRPSLVREYFGRKSFGTLFGLMLSISILGSAVGAPVAGWVYDNWHSYQGVWIVFAVLAVVALIFILITPKIRNPSR